MATYIPGLTDYIPQIQPFVPDYNFMGNILQAKQGKYDAAKKSIGDFYGKLLYSPMSKDENIQARDTFFKTVDSQIQKLSGIDLSLQQNQDYAMNIFKPFYENKYIVKDMGWTKHRDQQVDRGEYMKGCADPEKCGGSWWQGGEDYIKYKTKEFQDASLDESLGFDNVDFIPQQNIFPKAMKAITDAKFEMKMDYISGGYIVTDKNGKNMIPALSSYLQTMFGNDPKIQRYYQAQAYLERQNYVAGVGDKMSPEEAINSYYAKAIESSTKNITDNDNENKGAVDKTTILRKAIEKHIKDKGVLKNDKATIDAYVSIVQQQELAKQAQLVSQNGVNLIKNTSQNSKNTKLMGELTDQLVGNAMLNNHLNAAAAQYAMNTFEHTIKGADPYALSSFNREADFQDFVRKIPYEVNKAIAIEKAKAKLKKIEDAKILKNPSPRTGLPGATSESKIPGLQRKDNTRGMAEVTSHSEASMTEAISDAISTMSTTYLDSKSSEEQGAIKVALGNILKSSDYTPQEQMDILLGKTAFNPEKITSPQLKRIAYSQLQQLLNPTTDVGLANKSWTTDYQARARVFQTDVESELEQEKAFSVIVEEQTVELSKGLKSQWINDPVKGLLLESMLKQNKIAPMGASQNAVEFQAKEFAKTYGSKIKPKDGMTGEQTAYQYALNNVGKIKSEWDNYYDEHAQSWDDIFGGEGVAGRVGEGYAMEVDAHPDAADSPNNKLFEELYADIENNPGKTIFAFGSSGELPENDPKAEALSDLFYRSFQDGEKGRSRAYANMTVQNIAGGDGRYMGFLLQPSAEWIKSYAGTKNALQIASNPDLAKGIMIYLPKDNVSNDYYNRTKTEPGDIVLDKLKKIEIKSIPSGEVAITKIENGYYISGELRAFNRETKEDVIMKIKTPVYGAMLKGSDLQKVWKKDLMELYLYNEAARGNITLSEGIRTPEEIIQELMNPDGTGT